MIVFPNAKINIGLHVTERRSDGYHNIETVFYPVKIYDALEIIPHSGPDPEFTQSGSSLPAGEDNLCVRAFRLLEQEFSLRPVKIHLHKNIPAGAGLGGGSSDAAFTLRLLNDLFELGLSDEELLGRCRMLGSDCAFFLENRPVFAAGKGDEFSSLHLDLSAFYLVVAMPEQEVSTSGAYAEVVPHKPFNSLQMQLRTPLSAWRDTVKNDFEESVFKNHPVIAAVKEEFYRNGAVYASMSGSGSSVYGIFRKKTALPGLEKNCRVFYDVGQGGKY